MKRLFVIPMMILYLLSVSGVLISLHYCGQTLENWSVYADVGGCEDEEGCVEDPGAADECCNNKTVASKVSHDQHLAESLKFKISAALSDHIAPTLLATATHWFVSNDNAKVPYFSNAPPGLWQYIPLYKLHSRLTYYG